MNKDQEYLRKIAEYQFFKEMLEIHPTGIVSLVSDTFSLWDVVTEFVPRLKDQIMARDGKLVIRPDSGDPVDILCGYNSLDEYELAEKRVNVVKDHPSYKGVIELLWDIFGGTVNPQGFKILDQHIGAIYGDSITLERQEQIYQRLAKKGFAATNIVLGVGSFTYQMNTRDTLGFAAKGAWFECDGQGYEIYKDPATDDGTKKSLKGMVRVNEDFTVETQCTLDREKGGMLQVIYQDGEFYNQTTLTQVRERIVALSELKAETEA